MTRPFLLVNPRAAAGATGRHFDDIARAVRSVVGDCPHAFTERPLHAVELVREALRAGHDLIIAAGGDGTLNEVANGFFEPLRPGEAPRPVNPQAALGLIPRGTGGDFRRSVGLNGELEAAAQRLHRAPRSIDLGRVDFQDALGQPGSRLFINVAEAGLGAHAAGFANGSSKRLGGKVTFVLATLRALYSWSDAKVSARLDDRPPEEIAFTAFSIANGRFFGGGMMVAPEAELDDGLFHLTIWSGYGLRDFALHSASMYDGTHTRLAGTRVATARCVQLGPAGQGQSTRAPAQVPIEVDGDPIGHLPATFTVVPGAIRLVC